MLQEVGAGERSVGNRIPTPLAGILFGMAKHIGVGRKDPTIDSLVNEDQTSERGEGWLRRSQEGWILALPSSILAPVD